MPPGGDKEDMNFNGIDPTRVRMELRTVNPYAPAELKKPPFLLRLASALSGVAGAGTLAASAFMPALAPVGLLTYGLRNIFSRKIAQHNQQAYALQQAQTPKGPLTMSYVGYEEGSQSGRALDIMMLREQSFGDLTQAVGK